MFLFCEKKIGSINFVPLKPETLFFGNKEALAPQAVLT